MLNFYGTLTIKECWTLVKIICRHMIIGICDSFLPNRKCHVVYFVFVFVFYFM